MHLDGKAALITGAGSGVGRATSLRLGERGAMVLVSDLLAEAAERVVHEIRAAGGRAVAQQGDVAQDADCRALVERAIFEFGRLDVLVNNAGTTTLVPHDDLESVTDELWERTLSVNLKGSFQCARAAATALRADGGGEVVNVSSFAGVYGTGSSIPYCASKAGVNILTVILARVLGPNVRVNAVAPGFIDEPWLERALGPVFETAKKHMAQKSLLGRVSTADDIRDAILGFIEGSDMVTGQVLVVDGGLGIAG